MPKLRLEKRHARFAPDKNTVVPDLTVNDQPVTDKKERRLNEALRCLVVFIRNDVIKQMSRLQTRRAVYLNTVRFVS